ncbi:alcohol dehydrogenase catalytic domain-containing protein [candidate division KSB1 bacterium]|nr:alcohol dehydrogenase catalytic domain-containing protein [candidate division KSB1 bacterium]
METMKALVFKGIGKIELEQMPVPGLSHPADVIIKVAACGICGSDVKILEGKHAYKENIILGHEFNGVVVDIGEGVTSVKVGDRIALDNNPRCGLCDFCRMGMSSQCVMIKENTLGVFKHGGYAEYVVAPESVCFKLPPEIDDITATQVETLGTVLNGMNTVGMQPWDSVLVLGCGPIGYLFTALAKNIAAQVAVTEIDPFRIGVAKTFGIPVMNPDETDLEKEGKALTNGKGFDIVIDAVGTQLENALKYVTPGGKVLAFGMDDSVKATLSPYWVTRKAIKILGTYIGQNTILPAIRILQAQKIDLGPFFTETIPLERGIGAFIKLGLNLATMQHIPKKAMKITLKP